MAAAFLTLTTCAFGQPAAERPDPHTSYAIDQTRYFESPTAEQADLKRLLEAAQLTIASPPVDSSQIGAYLRKVELLLVESQRHSAYLFLRASRDIEDIADADASDKADAIQTRLVAAAHAALNALGREQFLRAVAADPALGSYQYLLDRAQVQGAHELPTDQQVVLNEILAPASASFWTLYQHTVRSTTFRTIETPDGPFNAKTDARVLNANPDRAVRRLSWESRMDGYASRAEIYAGILLGVVQVNTHAARLKHFADAPAMVYFRRDVDRDEVTQALATVQSHAELQKGYQRLQAQHFKSMTGAADAHIWDMPLPEPGFSVPRMTIKQAGDLSVKAVAPLGATYAEQLRELLDPRNGRLDVAAERGRRANGDFSVSAPGAPTGLFVENFGVGLLGDSRTLIHEGGHAVHAQLMHEHHVSPFYTYGPNWMFEAYATLNEFLLYDYLYEHAESPSAKVFYLRALIDDMTFSLFGSAEEGALEQAIYDGVSAGTIKNAADLDALTLSIWSRFEIWPAVDPKLSHYWITRSLMVQDPLYSVNYLYAGELAIKLFDMAQRRSADFQGRYSALLQDGFQAPAPTILKNFFGRDLSQQDLVDADMKVIERHIAALSQLYDSVDSSPRAKRKALH